MNRSGWPSGDSGRESGTASHGQASTMGCQWFLSLGGRGLHSPTRVSAAIPPLRSTVIFMARFLGFRGCRAADCRIPAFS